MADYHLLAECDGFLVIDKAPGVSVHRDDSSEGLLDRICNDLGFQQLYLVHRLDKMTSGLLLLATNSTAAAQLGSLFQSRRIDKYYLALSDTKPARKQGLIKGDMAKSRQGSWKLIRQQNNPAVTRFISASVKPGLRAFLVKPLTGKTHQIRVALKSLGAAIIGDQRYHAKTSETVDRGYLHAWYLGFEWQGQYIDFYCNPGTGCLFQLPEMQQLLEQWTPPGKQAWPDKD